MTRTWQQINIHQAFQIAKDKQIIPKEWNYEYNLPTYSTHDLLTFSDGTVLICESAYSLPRHGDESIEPKRPIWWVSYKPEN